MFRTYDPEHDRLVAVKVFRLDITPEQAARLAEALGAGIGHVPKHPSLVRAHGAGVEGTLAYLAEEYVAAESLDVAMRHYAPASYDTVQTFIGQLAGAIDAARAAGIHHGSLHPRDVFLTPDLARANGFGVAEALEGIGLRPPVRRPYTPPERIAAGTWGPPADVFSLAAVAFELITGRRVTGLGSQISLGTREDDPRVTRMVTGTLAKAMAEDPTQRFETASALAAALEAAVAGEGPQVDVPRVAAARKATPKPRRRKTAPVVAAVADEPTGVDVDLTASAAVPVPELLPPPSEPEIDEPSPLLATDDIVPAEVPAVDAPDDWPEDVGALAPSDAMAAAVEPWSERAALVHDDADEGGWLFDDEPPPYLADEDRSARAEPEEADEPETRAAHDRGDAAPAASMPPPASVEPLAAGRGGGRGDGRGRTMTSLALVLVVGLGLGFAGGYFTGTRRAAAPAPVTQVAERAAMAVDKAAPVSVSEAPRAQAARPTPLGTTGTTGAVAPPTEVPPPLGGGPSTAVTAPPPGPGPSRPSPAPKPTALPAPAKAPKRGQVLVRSTPGGADVLVNGRLRGETPVEMNDVPMGRYTIEVREPGYVAQSRQVTVTSARPTAIVEVRLNRAAAPPSAAEAAGSLEIDSRPRGARIYFDDHLIGDTPLAITTVPVGAHQIRIELAGHRVWSTGVTIVAGRRERVAGSLEKQ